MNEPDTDEVKAMAERIERARKFIATEYADPSQLPKGDWISPAAKPAHDALCLVLEQLDRLSAQAQAQGSGTVKVTTIRQLADDPNSASGKSLRDVPVTHPSAGPAVREEGLPYGIIDPDYAAFFTVARLVAWSYGYGVGLHGSFTRDLDLILVPWTDRANPDPDHVLKNIESRSGWKRIKDDGSKHPHGRLVWTLTSRRFECPRFIDIGFMPLTTPDPRGPSVEEATRAVALSYARKDLEPTSEATLALYRDDAEHAARAVLALFPAQAGGEKDDVQTRPQNEESAVADTSCTKSASLSDPGEKFWAGLKANAETRRTESAGFPPRAVFADPILHSDTKKG